MAKYKDGFVPIPENFIQGLLNRHHKLKEVGSFEYKNTVDFYYQHYKSEFIRSWMFENLDNFLNYTIFEKLFEENTFCMYLNPLALFTKTPFVSMKEFYQMYLIPLSYTVTKQRYNGYPALVQLQNYSNELKIPIDKYFEVDRECVLFNLLLPEFIKHGTSLGGFVRFKCEEIAKFKMQLFNLMKYNRAGLMFDITLPTSTKDDSELDNRDLVTDKIKTILNNENTSDLAVLNVPMQKSVRDIQYRDFYDKIRIEIDKIDSEIRSVLGLVNLNIPEKKERSITAETDNATLQTKNYISLIINQLNESIKKLYIITNGSVLLRLRHIYATDEDTIFEIYSKKEEKEENK